MVANAIPTTTTTSTSAAAATTTTTTTTAAAATATAATATTAFWRRVGARNFELALATATGVSCPQSAIPFLVLVKRSRNIGLYSRFYRVSLSQFSFDVFTCTSIISWVHTVFAMTYTSCA